MIPEKERVLTIVAFVDRVQLHFLYADHVLTFQMMLPILITDVVLDRRCEILFKVFKFFYWELLIIKTFFLKFSFTQGFLLIIWILMKGNSFKSIKG